MGLKPISYVIMVRLAAVTVHVRLLLCWGYLSI
jgi:ABC-type transporter Mla maintaining outer membrane lipid asymmetry permease subunit MlaE